jgi:hypothetical protein
MALNSAVERYTDSVACAVASLDNAVTKIPYAFADWLGSLSESYFSRSAEIVRKTLVLFFATYRHMAKRTYS